MLPCKPPPVSERRANSLFINVCEFRWKYKIESTKKLIYPKAVRPFGNSFLNFIANSFSNSDWEFMNFRRNCLVNIQRMKLFSITKELPKGFPKVMSTEFFNELRKESPEEYSKQFTKKFLIELQLN